jgi:hypothetical protein
MASTPTNETEWVGCQMILPEHESFVLEVRRIASQREYSGDRSGWSVHDLRHWVHG